MTRPRWAAAGAALLCASLLAGACDRSMTVTALLSTAGAGR